MANMITIWCALELRDFLSVATVSVWHATLSVCVVLQTALLLWQRSLDRQSARIAL